VDPESMAQSTAGVGETPNTRGRHVARSDQRSSPSPPKSVSTLEAVAVGSAGGNRPVGDTSRPKRLPPMDCDPGGRPGLMQVVQGGSRC
jgi:hypothetical protein